MLGLKQELDFVLAADVVYGTDTEQWDMLVKTIKAVSGRHTLVVIANVHRNPPGHQQGEGMDRAFCIEALSEEFDAKPLPCSLLHPEFRKHGAGSCVIHVLRRKEENADSDIQGTQLHS